MACGLIATTAIANAQTVTCGVGGNTDFSNIITLRNAGPGPVPAGTAIHWAITAPQFKNSGDHTFQAALPSNGTVDINTKLTTPKGTPCAVTVPKKAVRTPVRKR